MLHVCIGRKGGWSPWSWVVGGWELSWVLETELGSSGCAASILAIEPLSQPPCSFVLTLGLPTTLSQILVPSWLPIIIILLSIIILCLSMQWVQVCPLCACVCGCVHVHVNVCMCAYACVCMCMYTHIYVYMCVYMQMCEHMCAFLHVCMCVYTACVHAFRCTCLCVYVCICVCMYMFMYLCVCLCVCACMYVHLCVYVCVFVCSQAWAGLWELGSSQVAYTLSYTILPHFPIYNILWASTK